MKNNKNFWLYAIGRFISLIGSGIQMVALPLYILDSTGSGTLMGVFSIMTLVPALVSAPFSGIIGDRKNRRNIMIYTDCGRGILICLLGIIAKTSGLSIYILFFVQALVSIMDSLFNSSSGALMPELIPKENLMEAMSIRGGLDGASMVIGPFIGGIIYAFGGIKTVFFLNGASFFICAVCSLFIVYIKEASKKEKMSSRVFISETKEALSFIRSNRGLLQLFTFAMVSNFLLAPMFDIIFPYALKKVIGFSADKYGYIFGCYTLGIAAGNIAIGTYFKRLGSKKLMKSGLFIETALTLIVCILIFPYFVAAFGGATINLFLVLSFINLIIGFFNAFVNTPISTNLQKLVPDEMRSRFFSLLGMFSQGAIPIGSFIYGILLDKMPYHYLILAINFLSILALIIFITTACSQVYEPDEK